MSRACEQLLRKGRRKGLPTTGTTTGYNRHRAAGETPCDPCREAFNAYNRMKDNRRRRAEGAVAMVNGHHAPEVRAKLAAYRGEAASSYRHGWAGTPTYISWGSMKNRCDFPKNTSYPNYGGRGITYDPRWADFMEFLADMGPRPEGCTLDRIDNDGDYAPGNVRWATRAEQNANRRDPGGWAARRAKHGQM